MPKNTNGRDGAMPPNKIQAVRLALDQLGPDAKPLAVRRFVKEHYGVEISTEVVSVYKGKLARQAPRRRKPGPKPKARVAGGPGEVSMKDLRLVKDIRDRVGASRLRELVELLA
jgi:hypothetical protein